MDRPSFPSSSNDDSPREMSEAQSNDSAQHEPTIVSTGVTDFNLLLQPFTPSPIYRLFTYPDAQYRIIDLVLEDRAPKFTVALAYDLACTIMWKWEEALQAYILPQHFPICASCSLKDSSRGVPRVVAVAHYGQADPRLMEHERFYQVFAAAMNYALRMDASGFSFSIYMAPPGFPLTVGTEPADPAMRLIGHVGAFSLLLRGEEHRYEGRN